MFFKSKKVLAVGMMLSMMAFAAGCGQSSWRRTGPLLCAGRFLQWDPGGVPGRHASHYGAGHAGPYGRNA